MNNAPSRVVNYTWDLSRATLNQYSSEDRLAPHEFAELHDCLCDGRGIIPRHQFLRLPRQTAGWPDLPLHNGVVGMATYCGPRGEQWLIAALVNASGKPRAQLVALRMTFDAQEPGVQLRNVICSPRVSRPGFLRWSFVTYRGLLYASNGFCTFIFDGNTWYVPSSNFVNPGDYRQVVSWETACVYENKLMVANTPSYANEILWAPAGIDVPLETSWLPTTVRGPDTASTLRGVSFAIGSNSEVRGLICGEEDGSMFWTEDGGVRWYKASGLPVQDNGISDVRFSSVSRNVAWAVSTRNRVARNRVAFGAIFKSTDGGETWGLVTSSTITNGKLDMKEIDSGDGAECIIWGGRKSEEYYCKAIISGDSGNNWEEMTFDSRRTFAISDVAILKAWKDVSGEIRVRAVATCIREDKEKETRFLRVLDSPIGDAKWIRTNGPGTSDFYAVAAVDETTAVAVGEDGKVCRTTNCGLEWTEISIPAGLTGTLYGIVAAPGDGQRLWACGDFGVVLYSQSGGLSWVQLSAFTGVSLFDICAIRESEDNITLWVVGAGGYVARSANGGVSWEDVSTPKYGNLLSNAHYLGTNESIVALKNREGLLYVFTDAGVATFVYDGNSLVQQHYLSGLVACNENCIQEYAGMFWVVGSWRGKRGVWVWRGGVDTPVCASTAVQTTVDRCLIEPTPQTLCFKWYGEQGWTIPTFPPGVVYGSKWVLDNGMLRLTTSDWSPIYSHGRYNSLGSPCRDEDCGVYIPNMTHPGFISVEYALNNHSDSLTNLRLRWHMAQTQNGKPTSWKTSRWYPLPRTDEGVLLGRCVFYLGPTITDNTEWISWELQGRRENDQDSVIVNSVTLKSFVRSDANAITAPHAVVFDNRLFVFLSTKLSDGDSEKGVVLIYSGNGESVTTATLGTKKGSIEASPGCSVIYDDRLVLGEKFFNALPSPNSSKRILYSAPCGFEYNTYEDAYPVQRIKTGWIDFADGNPDVGTMWKWLRRIKLVVESARKEQTEVSVVFYTNWEDSNHKSEVKLIVVGKPLSGDRYRLDRQVIELNAPPSNHLNMGKRFRFEVSAAAKERDFKLSGFQVEAELLEAGKATVWQ